jgi:phosphoribosylaminoimidazole (AIR) synthetase
VLVQSRWRWHKNDGGQADAKFDTIGIDLVSATTNDIVLCEPLTLLDYIANDKLNPAIANKSCKVYVVTMVFR